MSKTWYPMIDFEKCVECGICVEHCSHGVYDKDKAPRPVVINPENCVEGCTGCGSKCPQDAINYYGDSGEDKSSGCSCGGDCNCTSDNSDGENSGCGCGGNCNCG